MNGEDLGRIFSMSAFEALLAVRKHAGNIIGGPLEGIVAAVRLADPDADGYDYLAGIELHAVVSIDADHSVPYAFFRQCVFDLVVLGRQSWGRNVTRGRQRFSSLLDRNAQQCLRAAALMAEPPIDEVVEWWDRLSSSVRQAGSDENLRRGRLAERMSLEHERERLKKIGIALEPSWVSVQDNTAGHDVLSYSHGKEVPVSLRIEVKSTIASPLRFFLTRNEWNTATKAGDAYVFHVWDLAPDPPRLHVRTVKQIEPHVPEDRCKGAWETAIIPLSAQ